MYPSSTPFRTALILLSLVLPLGASAQARLDHRGAVGLLLGTGVDYTEAESSRAFRDSGAGGVLDLGVTAAVDYDGNEAMLLVRGGFGGPALDLAVAGGYRGYFGRDAVKTFFDLGLAAHVRPAFALGPRVGFGVQYELGSLAGVYLGGAAQAAGGDGFRFSGELVLGVQLRSYLLE